MKFEENRCYVNYRKSSRLSFNIFNKNDAKNHVKYINCEINKLKKNINAISRF